MGDHRVQQHFTLDGSDQYSNQKVVPNWLQESPRLFAAHHVVFSADTWVIEMLSRMRDFQCDASYSWSKKILSTGSPWSDGLKWNLTTRCPLLVKIEDHLSHTYTHTHKLYTKFQFFLSLFMDSQNTHITSPEILSKLLFKNILMKGNKNK